MSIPTYLSPGVRDLLLTASSISTGDATISIDRIRQCLVMEDQTIDYRASVRQLNQTVLPGIEHMFDQMTLEQFRTIYQQEKYSYWLSNKQDLFRIFEFLKGGEIHLATLLLTSFTERNLGNLLLLRTNTVPDLLRQIIESPILRDILAEDIVLIFQVLIGSPRSLNLRNIYWHGFVQHKEISSKWTYLLLYMLLEIGPMFEGQTIPQRTFWPLERFQHHTLIPSDLYCENADSLRRLFCDSPLIDEGSRPLFLSSVDYFFDRKEYGLSMILLLPLYEHLLRKLFVRANHCPERLLTAEATTLFTTLDEITACCLPNGNKNRLCDELGNGYMGLLGDLITFPDGVCLRSKLSHGEMDYRNIPESIAQTQLVLVLILLYRYDPSNLDTHAHALLNYIDHYQIGFHPIAIAKYQMYRWIRAYKQLPSLSSYVDDETMVDIETISSPMDLTSLWQTILSPDPNGLLSSATLSIPTIETLLADKTITLINRYCSCQTITAGYNELSLITLIRQIASHLHQICENLSNFIRIRGSAYQAKQLRANQRNNFDRFVSSYENLCQSFLFIGDVNARLLFSLDRIRTLGLHSSSIIIKFLRLWLTYVENTVTLSDILSNRWEEILVRYSTSIERTTKLLQKL